MKPLLRKAHNIVIWILGQFSPVTLHNWYFIHVPIGVCSFSHVILSMDH